VLWRLSWISADPPSFALQWRNRLEILEILIAKALWFTQALSWIRLAEHVARVEATGEADSLTLEQSAREPDGIK